MTDSAPATPVTTESLNPLDDHAVADFYQRVIVPHFPPDELDSEHNMAEYLREGQARALVARTAGGAVAGGAVCDWFPASSVLLLSYLAVLPEYRDLGVGGLLLQAVRGDWSADLRPVLIVAEVEDPRFHHDATYGDSARRARFYERAGALALPLDYLQPALRPETTRVRHLMLLVLGGSALQPGTRLVDGLVVEQFLAEYFEESEGTSPDDPDGQALLAACRRPGGLPLVPVSAFGSAVGATP